MKIVHLCLSCFYIDGYGYQENQLPAQHVRTVTRSRSLRRPSPSTPSASPATWSPLTTWAATGRVSSACPYRAGLPAALARKVRAYPGVRRWLDALQPDVILFHGMCAWELLTVARYARAHPSVQLYVDCHEDFNNSARGWVSRQLLHASFYRPIFAQRARRGAARAVHHRRVHPVRHRFLPRAPQPGRTLSLAGHIHDDADYHARRPGSGRPTALPRRKSSSCNRAKSRPTNCCQTHCVPLSGRLRALEGSGSSAPSWTTPKAVRP